MGVTNFGRLETDPLENLPNPNLPTVSQASVLNITETKALVNSMLGSGSASLSHGLQETITPGAGDGAIGGGLVGTIMITKAGACLLSLPAPAAVDDGKTLTIVSNTAFAHVVTTPANKVNGNKDTLTFAAAVGNNIVLRAYNQIWWMISQIGITLTEV